MKNLNILEQRLEIAYGTKQKLLRLISDINKLEPSKYKARYSSVAFRKLNKQRQVIRNLEAKVA